MLATICQHRGSRHVPLPFPAPLRRFCRPTVFSSSRSPASLLQLEAMRPARQRAGRDLLQGALLLVVVGCLLVVTVQRADKHPQGATVRRTAGHYSAATQLAPPVDVKAFTNDRGFTKVTRRIIEHHLASPKEEGDSAVHGLTPAALSAQCSHEVFARYPDIDKRAGHILQQQILRLFYTVTQFMMDEQIDYWLEYGTLLGWWRDRRVLRYDHDIDIGMDEENWTKFMGKVDRLSRFGCGWTSTAYRHEGRNKGIIWCSWMYPNPTEGADVYGFSGNGTHHFPPVLGNCKEGLDDWSKPCADCPIPIDWVKPLICNASLHGVPGLCVPARARTYLKRTYGSLARGATCNRKYCCKDGDGAVLPQSHSLELPQESAFAGGI
eukprot:TRINITY_DN8426_c0_g3_i1.p1 TRINITY_DN8426_c0_g3~~TRINITY_DN8426_c0_g3_i1.p1  ORF type:complete len:380 (+),score=29.57 TRINITY_DN8426_c0_g3_i1:271-1410(+)